MTGRIIPLRGEPHERIQSLLPWFVTGRLDAAEVEAHLSTCPECRAEERLERRLEAQVTAIGMDVEQGWSRLRARLNLVPPARRAGPLARLTAAWRNRRPSGRLAWLGWAMAVQVGLLALLLVLVSPLIRDGVRVHGSYRALGAAPTPRAANAIIMFRPDTPERDLRAALLADGARLVDGPTAAGVYELHVPAATRAALLATLRRRAGVVMAEPIDAAGSP